MSHKSVPEQAAHDSVESMEVDGDGSNGETGAWAASGAGAGNWNGTPGRRLCVETCMMIAIVHDLAEGIVGDLVIEGEAENRDKITKEEKTRLEAEAIARIFSLQNATGVAAEVGSSPPEAVTDPEPWQIDPSGNPYCKDSDPSMDAKPSALAER